MQRGTVSIVGPTVARLGGVAIAVAVTALIAPRDDPPWTIHLWWSGSSDRRTRTVRDEYVHRFNELAISLAAANGRRAAAYSLAHWELSDPVGRRGSVRPGDRRGERNGVRDPQAYRLWAQLRHL
jgi:hypothetical protein